MNPQTIITRIEELSRQEDELWISIDPHELAAQIKGQPLTEATSQKIAKANEIRHRINSLNIALYAAVRSTTHSTPPMEVPLH